MSVKRAQAIVRIANTAVLSDPRNQDRLPASWRTRDEIARLAGDGIDVQSLLDTGVITIATPRETIASMRSRPMSGHGRPGRPRKHDAQAALDTLTAAVRRFIQDYYAEAGALRELRELLMDTAETLTRRMTELGAGTSRGPVPVTTPREEATDEEESLDDDRDVDEEDDRPKFDGAL